MSSPTPPADPASPRPAVGGRGPWLSEGHHEGRAAIYTGSLTAYRGAPVWVDRVIDTVDDGSLLGLDLYQVTLADGTGTLLGVRHLPGVPRPDPRPHDRRPRTAAAGPPGGPNRRDRTPTCHPRQGDTDHPTDMRREGPTMATDVTIVLEAMQTQIDALNRAVKAQQATIDALTDLVIDLAEARDADPR